MGNTRNFFSNFCWHPLDAARARAPLRGVVFRLFFKGLGSGAIVKVIIFFVKRNKRPIVVNVKSIQLREGDGGCSF